MGEYERAAVELDRAPDRENSASGTQESHSACCPGGPLDEDLEDQTVMEPDGRAVPGPAAHGPHPGVLDRRRHLLPQERPQVAVPLRRIRVEDEIGRRPRGGQRRSPAGRLGGRRVATSSVSLYSMRGCSPWPAKRESAATAYAEPERPRPSTRGTGTSGVRGRCRWSWPCRKGVGTAARSRADSRLGRNGARSSGTTSVRSAGGGQGARISWLDLVAPVPRGTERGEARNPERVLFAAGEEALPAVELVAPPEPVDELDGAGRGIVRRR